MCDHESCSNATTAVPAGADLGELGDRIAELSAHRLAGIDVFTRDHVRTALLYVRWDD